MSHKEKNGGGFSALCSADDSAEVTENREASSQHGDERDKSKPTCFNPDKRATVQAAVLWFKTREK